MPSQLCITSPWDGDILTRHDGEETADGLRLVVEGRCDGGPVTVNGVAAEVGPADADGPTFRAAITLPPAPRRQAIVAQAGGRQAAATVTYLARSRPRFRFSVDDNVQFLADLARDPAAYPSLFDHWYLAFWRRMHETYGAKIHINIYYQTPEGFRLPELPDRWRDEWRAASSWLHHTFHALQDKPDRIYRYATAAQIAADYELVTEEIKRFAGPELLSQVTTVHWAEAPREAVRALHGRGLNGFIGIFASDNGRPTTAYYLTEEQAVHVAQRDAWEDTTEGVVFIECDLVVNSVPLAQVVPHLEAVAASPQRSEMMELLIHEQYFRQELMYHQPDVMQKVEAALGWVTERGYEPVFWGDGFLGM